MSNYRVNSTPQTRGCFAASIVATAILLNLNPPPIEYPNKLDFMGSGYSQSASPSSFDCNSNIFTGKINSHIDMLADAVSNLYTQLLTNQEPLGKDLAQILHENLWDLYES